MPQSLGSIFVDLFANTGGFVAGMQKAAAEAQKASKEISRSFGDLLEIAEQTFSPFGEQFAPAVSKLSFVLQSAGSAASSMMKEFGKMGGALGPLASLGAGAAVGLAATSATMVGIAMHAAEAAAKMNQLAQATGVPVATLSGLSFAAKAVDVDTQTLATGLERMSKSAEAAATAPAGATSAYSRLGVALRDSSGSIRPAQALFIDLANKFASMPDGVEKTALAMQIFGRGGAALIPVLNQGGAAIAEIIEYATKVGAVLSGPAAEAAEKYEKTIAKISLAVIGAENALLVKFLPAMQAVTTEMAKASASGNSFGKDFLSVLSLVVKGTIIVGDTLYTVFGQMSREMKLVADSLMGFGEAIALAVQAAARGDWSGVGQAFRDELSLAKGNLDSFLGDSKSMWTNYAGFVKQVWSGEIADTGEKGGKTTPPGGRPAPSGPMASGRPDVVAELIARLQSQAAAEIALASATERSTAASLLGKAAVEAETKIAETRSHLLEQEKSLREQLADARKQSDAGEKGGGERALKLQAEIAGLQRMLAELNNAVPRIKSAYADIAAGGFGAKASKDLESFITKTNEETEALRALDAAYAKGPEAVAGAQVSAKLAPYERQLATMREIISRMKALQIPTGPVGSTSLIGSLFGNLGQAASNLETQISRARKAEEGLTAGEIFDKLTKTGRELASQAEAYGVLASAALKSAAAQREAAAEAAAIKFRTDNPAASAGDVAKFRQEELDKLTQERSLTIAQAAAQYSLNASYAQELEKLQEIRSFLQSSGESTLAIDETIYEARIKQTLDYRKQVFDSQNEQLLAQQKIFDLGVQLTEEWDRAANSVGTIGDKFRAMINEMELQGDQLGSKVFQTFGKSLEDLSSQLAKFVVTGKNGFREMIQSMEESLLKASFQKSFSLILQKVFPSTEPGQNGQNQNVPWSEQIPGAPGKGGFGGIAGAIGGIFGIKLPGAGKPAGTSADPFYVAIVNAAAAAGDTSQGGPISAFSELKGLPIVGGIFGDFGKIFGAQGGTSTGKPDGSQSNPFFTIASSAAAASATAGASGSVTSSLSSLPIVGSLFKGLGLGGGGGAGSPDGSQQNPFYVVSSDSSGSGGGGLSSLLSSFGGGGSDSGGGDGGGGLADLAMMFMASGGRTTPGVPYIVGENNPEIFVPDQSGRIIPSLAAFANSPEARSMRLIPNFAGIARRESGVPFSPAIHI